MRNLRFLPIFAGLLIAGMAFAQTPAPKASPKSQWKKATFAGGCFWSMQVPFDKVKGVSQTEVGFSTAWRKSPGPEQSSRGRGDAVESIEITFDPAQVGYEQLLEIYWHNIDPTQDNGQFADIGPQYRTYIFVHDEDQRKMAEASKEQLAQSGRFTRPIAVKIAAVSPFRPAEEFHQKYAKKNPSDYYEYAEGSGRYPFIRRVWGIDPRK